MSNKLIVINIITGIYGMLFVVFLLYGLYTLCIIMFVISVVAIPISYNKLQARKRKIDSIFDEKYKEFKRKMEQHVQSRK